MAKPPTDEDQLDELPPIDGDEVEAEEPGAEELDEEPADAGDPLDDSTGEGDPLEEIETSGSESGWLEDASESDALDVGTPDTFGKEEDGATLLEGAEGADESGEGEDDLPAIGGAEDGSVVGDAGEEGFEDEEEALREEDLPRLDSDEDEADSDDAELLEGLPDEEASEEPRPPWDDRAWERVEGEPSGVAAVDALATGPEGLVVAGQGLGRIDRIGARPCALDALGLRGGAPRSVALDGARIFVATPRAGILVSDDRGKSFREANGWRPLVRPGEADGALEMVLVGGELWGRGTLGSLVWSGDGGATWAPILPTMRFDAIAGDTATGHLVALAGGDGGSMTIARGSGGRLALAEEGLLPAGKIRALAAYNGHLAVAMASGAFRAQDGAWHRLDGTAGLTAMTFARGDGTLIVALHSEGEGRAWILEARAGAPALTVAEVGEGEGAATEDGDDVRVRALCWDESAGVVWAAGGFGLIAFRPAHH
jgi:hypothetical protein